MTQPDLPSVLARIRAAGWGCFLARLFLAVPYLLFCMLCTFSVPDASVFSRWWAWVTLRQYEEPRGPRAGVESEWVSPAIADQHRGRVTKPLRPSGKVRIDTAEHPAQSETGWIDADVEVEVVGRNAFGLIVRPVSSAASDTA
jgi:hypothetical protein